MREILFRGKRTDNGEWVSSGNLLHTNEDNSFFIPIKNSRFLAACDENDHIVKIGNGIFYKVIPETVGQFTGLTDKNGTKIFEGDIVCVGIKKHGCNATELVFYDGGGFSPFAIPGWECTPDADGVEVIGNIHDNPELLGGDYCG